MLTAEKERALVSGASFRECAEDCPEMIVVPAGEFMMGSPETEKDRYDTEGPQHNVSIARDSAIFLCLLLRCYTGEWLPWHAARWGNDHPIGKTQTAPHLHPSKAG